jgi:Fe-S-cluster containining protein
MEEAIELEKLYQIIDKFSNKLVSCRGCTKCCESGVVYVLPEEVEHLKSKGVPLINIEGIDYIKRNNGVCSMLDKQHSNCSISFYKDRPLCCRMFPLDIFNRQSHPSWGVYNYCPQENVKPILLTSEKPELDLFIISIIADSMERALPKKVLNFIINEDRVTAEIELLDDHADDFITLDRIVRS